MALTKLAQRHQAKKAKQKLAQAASPPPSPSPSKPRSSTTPPPPISILFNFINWFSSKKTSFLLTIAIFSPLYFLTGIYIFRKLFHSALTSPASTCRGICTLPTPPPSQFDSCAPRDSSSLLFLRIPKTGSTHFLSVASTLSKNRKGFRLSNLPDYPPAVAGYSGRVVSEHSDVGGLPPVEAKERKKYYQGVMTKIAVESNRPAGGGVPWKNAAGLVSEAEAAAITAGGVDRRSMWYSHMFLPDLNTSRHFQEQSGTTTQRKKLKLKLKPKPAVITMLRDPVKRLSSEYNYLRSAARSSAHVETYLSAMGGSSLGSCVHSGSECINSNQLKKMCSVQALYLCGDHDDCLDVGDEGRILERARINMADNILLVGTVEQLDVTLKTLEILLPTYFQFGTSVAGGLGEDQGVNERNFKNILEGGRFASNRAPDYESGLRGGEERILGELCSLDNAVYEYAVELLRERAGVCASNL